MLTLLAALVGPWTVAESTAATTVTESPAAPATPRVEADPLTLTIDSLTPAVIPRKGPITMKGTVTNDSLDEWQDIKVYPRLSHSPFTTSQEVRLATESDPRLPFGDRITSEGHFDAGITQLAPGETRSWSIRIPRAVVASRISGSEGTYQIGVQALGATEDGRPENAVGRARTFISLMNPGHDKVATSVVVPIRRGILRNADGALSDESDWTQELGSGGRLANLATLLSNSGNAPVTMLVDPAVLSAAEQLAEGNLPRVLEDPEEDASSSSADSNLTLPAQVWLEEITSIASDHEVLGLPYGDIDVASAATYDEELLRRARKLSQRTLSARSISATPAVVPPSGLLPVDALASITDRATLLMSSEAVPGATDEITVPSTLRVGKRTMSIYDPSLMAEPEGEPLNALSARQRVLAEASVRSLSGSKQALVANLPSDFDPGESSTDFFSGLDQSFVDLRGLSQNTGGPSRESEHLDYPKRQEIREIHPSLFTAADELIAAGATLDEIVTTSDSIASHSLAEALNYTSYMMRDHQSTAERHSIEARDWLRDRLDLVTIDAPEFVILSAASGPFAVTITNGLDVPVTLAIEAHTRDDLEIMAPGEIELGANASRTIQLDAKANSIGVHSVELLATDLQGRPIGTSEQMSVRSNSVGKVIWVILGVGVGILFLAIPVRWIRRHRKKKAAADEVGS
ncbi:hypothetical protein ASG90_18450 [Nocardioides sp. Soil797]|nr:hypothetical protein ASG90_18450 [Nocardioides sp. Soil797]